MKSSKRRRRTGTLLFFIPIVLVVAIIVYAIIAGTASPVGTLIVTAESSDRYTATIGLNATVTIGASHATTPHSFSLDQGTYTVVYSSLPWYSSPPQRVINVSAGKTSYAVGVYNPTVEAVSIVGSGFNVTKLRAMHGVTPVVWVNRTGSTATLVGGPMGGVEVPPSQNFTYVFRDAGNFLISVSSSSSGSVSIAVV